eukprot:TRINITY_DN39244_c0_g1_i1.p1 TRINITY_DN39244_c0_g1~~TRINITY_DN39244_c0_g1_i1.p1  ORF type:complete len:387 (+),score=138.07 TRINITY_DN39244_c0_g1_i1:61-1161(+)
MALQLFVRLQDSTVVSVDVAPDATVGELKISIAEAGGPHPSKQLLKLADAGIGEDWIALSDTQLSMEATLHVEDRVPQRRSVATVTKDQLTVIRADGGVSCMRFGDRSFSGPEVELRGRVRSVHCGKKQLLALLADGSIQSMRKTTHNPPPEEVLHNRVRQLATGGSIMFSVALLESGKVVCWGDLWAAPEELSERTVVQISAGADHAMALTDDGKVFAWGFNRYGQTWMPTAEDEELRAVSVSAGVCNSAIVFEDGSVRFVGRRPGMDGLREVVPAGSGVVDCAAAVNALYMLYEDGVVAARGEAHDVPRHNAYAAISTTGRDFCGVLRDLSAVVVLRFVPGQGYAQGFDIRKGYHPIQTAAPFF